MPDVTAAEDLVDPKARPPADVDHPEAANPPDDPEAPGLTWLPLSSERLAGWHELLEAMSTADDSEHFAPDDLVDEITPDWIDLASDSRIGLDVDGRAVAFGMVQLRPGDRTMLRPQCWGGVHPEHRRQGLGRPLLRWQLSRARALAVRRRAEASMSSAQAPGLAIVLADAQATGNSRLLAAEGFEVVRWFSVMRRDLADSAELPAAAHLPTGLRIVPFDAALDDAVREAHNEAFRDHWWFQPWTADNWQQRETGNRDFHPEWSFLALTGDGADQQVAGYVLCAGYPADWEAQGFTEGWVSKLGVRRPWRGQAVAKNLLIAALRAFSDSGLNCAGLDVDSANPTGAVGLYTGLGFQVRQRTGQWGIEI